MEAGDEPTQAAAFLAAVSRNASIAALLDRLETLDLPDACLAGGCLFQTVWNLAHDFAPAHGITDYDVFYFDAADLSADAEAATAQRVRARAADLALAVDVRNQARVHLWYPDDFGAPSPPFRSVEDAIDHFLAPCCAFGLRKAGGRLAAYAPFGYSDLFSLTVRPNPRRATALGVALRDAYGRKVERWRRQWPKLTVFPWS